MNDYYKARLDLSKSVFPKCSIIKRKISSLVRMGGWWVEKWSFSLPGPSWKPPVIFSGSLLDADSGASKVHPVRMGCGTGVTLAVTSHGGRRWQHAEMASTVGNIRENLLHFWGTSWCVSFLDSVDVASFSLLPSAARNLYFGRGQQLMKLQKIELISFPLN